MQKSGLFKESENKMLPQRKSATDYKYIHERPCSIVIVDHTGIINYANDGYCKISKYGKSELLGQVYVAYNSQNDTENFICSLLLSITQGKIWLGKLRGQAKDGNRYYIDTRIIPFFDTDGNPYQYVLLGSKTIQSNIAGLPEINDINIALQNEEKEKRAAELIAANEKLVFQNEEKEKRAAELIVANNELAFQNEEKEKRAAELIIANLELVFQNAEKEKRAAELIIANQELVFQNKEKEKRAAELVIANNELAFQNKEKEKRAAELIIANEELLFQNKEKEKRAGELIIANLELESQNKEKEKRAAELKVANQELKNAEENIRRLKDEDIRKLNEELEQKVIDRTAELESVNKELESFSYSVSHDLRAPLRSVNGYALILEEDYHMFLDDEGRRLLTIVQQSAKKMGTLIDDLLAFSRLGRNEINKSKVDMADLVESTLHNFSSLPEFKAVVQIKNLQPALADITMMKQVWVNLLSNALKYSYKNDSPVVIIDSEEKNGTVVYSISDNGVGFDMDYADKLFGVFQRLHDVDEFEGTGVGLALVHRIITKHGGKISAKAEVGKGATFYFSLPVKL